MRDVDIKGQRFGRLIAKSRAKDARPRAWWLCQCDCGRECVVSANSLRQGATKSCGCLQRDSVIRTFTTHGHATSGRCSRTYRIWLNMRTRCSNPKCEGFHRYGGRGITVCAQWLTFANFLADMGEVPAGKSIDRIDGNKGYQPSNCRWATPLEQAANTIARTHHVTIGGTTKTLRQWCLTLKRNYSVVTYRVRNGAHPLDALEASGA